MDFSLPPELQQLQQRTRAFIRDKIIPLEGDKRQTHHGPTEEFRQELVALAARPGSGGAACRHRIGRPRLNHVGKAVVFEEAGYSLLGPVAMHIFAPDEGNMHLLEAVASHGTKGTLAAAAGGRRTRSCFCMTEPAPGAGSDPAALQTTARAGRQPLRHQRRKMVHHRRRRGGLCHHHGEGRGRTTRRCSWPTWTRPGIEIVRAMDSLDSAFAGGHAVVRFNNLRVPAIDILGEPGKGFRYAQVRLAPARLTHCMRWLGAARRAHRSRRSMR